MKLTKRILQIITVGLLIYEAYTFINRATNDTISEAIWESGDKRPYIHFFLGLVCGHWCWPRKIEVEVHKEQFE